MATALIHLRNTQEVLPKLIQRTTKVYSLDKKRNINKKITIGSKTKGIYLRRTKDQPKSNLVIPMYTKEHTHVYTGRTKEFYMNPEWRAKADAIKASKKKTLANFGKGKYNGHA